MGLGMVWPSDSTASDVLDAPAIERWGLCAVPLILSGLLTPQLIKDGRRDVR